MAADGRSWRPVYMQLGRYADSANAWRNVLLLLGENAERQAHLGEALFAEANGVVTDEANHAWTRAVALDKRMISARYYLGIAAEQDGNREKAIEIWRELIAEAPADGHWVSDVRAAIARVEAAPATSSPGPTIAQAAAAAKLPPDQQFTMIRGMVDGLAARLKQDGSDLEGWVKLVRSYKILGEADQAKAAIRDAQQAFAGDPARREKLDLALKELESGTILRYRRFCSPCAARGCTTTARRRGAGHGGATCRAHEKCPIGRRWVDHADPFLYRAW